MKRDTQQKSSPFSVFLLKKDCFFVGYLFHFQPFVVCYGFVGSKMGVNWKKGVL